VVSPGDGAFYGPKIEYTLKDALGRQWQCGTMQVDFNTAERLGAEYVTETSGRAHPVMLHRAIVGSLERFIGMLVEHHAGALPAWLAPVQVAVLNITDGQADTPGNGQNAAGIKGLGLSSICATRRLRIKYASIRCKSRPYILVVGDKEKAAGAVAVRARGNKDLGVMSLEAFSERSPRTSPARADLTEGSCSRAR
jgi:threonyl-tRNA synthetase